MPSCLAGRARRYSRRALKPTFPGNPPPPRPDLGLGSATFGRECGEPDARHLLQEAAAHGITHLDTAPAYSLGRSEEIIGGWLAAHPALRPRLTIATKLSPPYTRERMLASAEASLRRLGVEAVDLLYLHSWDASATEPEALTGLDDLVRMGRARAIGLSNASIEQLEEILRRQEALGVARCQDLQNNHNYAVRGAGPRVRARCRALGVGVTTYSPLGAGFLTGKHRDGVAPGSRFAVAPAHGGVYFHPPSWRRLAALEDVAKRHGIPSPLLALAWALSRPGTSRVLVGGRTADHVPQALAARNLDAAAALADLERQEPEED